jgi:predicted Zn-dependent protease
MKKLSLTLFLVPFVLLAGCAESIKVLASAPEYIDTAVNVAGKLSKAIKPIADEEEYYIGRAVAAKILSSYNLLQDPALTGYVNLVGRTVALRSERPFLYGGYHFAVLDTSEINAFACPGGIIFITRGMLEIASGEDELAAVLAHEIAHVNHYDGIASIKSARWTAVLTAVGSSAAKQYGSEEVSQLAAIFDGAIDDVVKTLVVKGYSRSKEYAADEAGRMYLAKAGYDPAALKEFLNNFIRKGKSTEGGILKTHPATAERIDKLMANKLTAEKPDTALVAFRTGRFLAALNPSR